MNSKTKKNCARPAGYRKEKPSSVAIPSIRVTPGQLEIYKAASEVWGPLLGAWGVG